MTSSPHLISVVLLIICLHSSALASASTAGKDATRASDDVDLASGIRQYLQLMSASMTKGLGYSSESNVNTFRSATSLEADVSNRIDANTDEGKEAFEQLELQSRYTNNELGEKNLMWSLRGSHSEETLRKNLENGSNEEVSAPIYYSYSYSTDQTKNTAKYGRRQAPISSPNEHRHDYIALLPSNTSNTTHKIS